MKPLEFPHRLVDSINGVRKRHSRPSSTRTIVCQRTVDTADTDLTDQDGIFPVLLSDLDVIFRCAKDFEVSPDETIHVRQPFLVFRNR